MNIEERFRAAGQELREAEVAVELAMIRYQAAHRAFDRVAQRRRAGTAQGGWIAAQSPVAEK